MGLKVMIFLVMGFSMLGMVDAVTVFHDGFEDNTLGRWDINIDGIGTWSTDGTDSAGLEDKGNGDYFAKAIHVAGQSHLTLKDSINMTYKEDCYISFYSASSGASSPKLKVSFYDGNWDELTEIDLKTEQDLTYREIPLDNSWLTDSAKIRFTVTNPGGYAYIDDVSLECLTTEEMNVFIEAPNCGDAFLLGETSYVNVTATDLDDVILGNISIDDEVVTFTNGKKEIEHTWTKAGNIQIELYAKNSDGFRRDVITSVMVIDPAKEDLYLSACLDEPSGFADIASTNVYFDASSTRGLSCPAGVTDIEADCNPVDRSNMLFSWRFSDGLVNFHHDPDESDLAYKFYKNFARAGENWAILEVEFKEGVVL